MASGLVNMGQLVGATLGVAVLGILFGGRVEQTAGSAGHFMAGLHATFLIGGIVELAGGAIAVLWLRANSLGTKEVGVSGQERSRLPPNQLPAIFAPSSAGAGPISPASLDVAELG